MCFHCNHTQPTMFSTIIPTHGLDNWEPVGVSARPASSSRTPWPHRVMQNIRSISSCIHRNAAIDCNGNLWIWGANSMARMEDGMFSIDIPQKVEYIPKKIMGNTHTVSCGGWHTLCITNDKKLWAWGQNKHGQLGLGDRERRETPTFVMDSVKFICANEFQSFAIKNDGTLWGWGSNESGVLLDAQKDCLAPKFLMDSVIHVSCGNDVIAAIRQDNSLWVWGNNVHNIIFTRPQYRHYNPLLLMTNVIDVSLSPSDGSDFGLIVSKDHDLYCFGGTKFGSKINMQLRKLDENTPIKLMDNISNVYTGNDFFLIQDLCGNLFAFGRNDLGQCGTGRSTGTLKRPTLIMTHVKQASVGHYHGMGLQENGDLWIWGGDYGLPSLKK